jgi:hypothetical protein
MTSSAVRQRRVRLQFHILVAVQSAITTAQL